jgi:hypothetical protein
MDYDRHHPAMARHGAVVSGVIHVNGGGNPARRGRARPDWIALPQNSSTIRVT